MYQIVEYIRSHSNGRSNPVTGNEIAYALSIPNTLVRKHVNEARSNGLPICSCGRGYYITDNKDEIQRTINSIEGRIAGMQNAISGLKGCLQDA